MIKYIDHWNEDVGIYVCRIKLNTKNLDLCGVGVAECHPNDLKYKSQFTGGFIAENRAKIDLIKQLNKTSIKPSILTLKHVIGTMQHSKNYNPDSYEAKRIQKELDNLINEYNDNIKTIEELKDLIKNYIEEKDKYHKKLDNGQI